MKKNIAVSDMARWIIEEGTRETGYGNWIIDFSEIAAHFDQETVFIEDNLTELISELECSEEVADVEIEGAAINTDYNLSYCENLHQDVFMRMFEYLDPDLMIPQDRIRLLDEMLEYTLGIEYPDYAARNFDKLPPYHEVATKRQYVSNIESYGVTLYDVQRSQDKWGEFIENAIRDMMYCAGLSRQQIDEAIVEGEFPTYKKVMDAPQEVTEMNFSKRTVEETKQKYPIGTRIELSSMCNDEPGMPRGLRGTVVDVDDQPALIMNWDNGRGLSLLPDEDSFRTLSDEEIKAEQMDQDVQVTPKIG